MAKDDDDRRRLALEAIPKEWITRDTALVHIMAVEQCSLEEAEAVFDEFAELCPDSVMTVTVQ